MKKDLGNSSFRISLGLRVLAWIGFAWAKGLEPQAATWIEILLMASVLILMPLARHLGHHHGPLNPSGAKTELMAGLLLVPALLSPIPSVLGAVGVGFWLIHQMRDATWIVWRWKTTPPPTAAYLCHRLAFVFPSIGAAWLLAHRLNWMPFGFDSLMVLLTAAHFHHAGFTLPLITGCCSNASPSRLSKLACLAVIAGVPLVATGITCTHFGVLPWMEPLGVSVLILGAFIVGGLQMRMASAPALSWMTRSLFVLSGLSLLVAMLLALGYGLRSYLPQWALPMPAMWAIHGTLNGFGFGLCGILAWRRRFGF